MTISRALKLATAQLNQANITLPPLEAEILLSGILKKPREFLLTHPELKLKAKQISSFHSLISRRLKGEPIAYLTGHKEFYGLDFIVNKNVLIPRPETELMVEEAWRITHNAKRLTLIDVGAGSGCVIIALAKRITNYGLRITNYKFLATDISTKALTVARQNAHAHQINEKIKFIKGDLLEPIINNTKYKIQNTKFVILANLPYGWKAWKNNCSMDTLGLKFEPQVALFARKSGLKLYEKLFKQMNYLSHHTKYKIQNTKFMLCEFDPRQTKMMKQLVKKYLPKANLQIKKDLAGLNRLAVIKM